MLPAYLTSIILSPRPVTADSITLSIGGQLTLTANNISITPGSDTLATIHTASLTFGLLDGLKVEVTGLEIRQTGFTIDSATASVSDITLGGLLALQAPTIITLTNINYSFGGTLSGTVGFDTTSAVLHVVWALENIGQSFERQLRPGQRSADGDVGLIRVGPGWVCHVERLWSSDYLRPGQR